MLGGGPLERDSSWRRFASPRNSASSSVQRKSQFETGTSIATPPGEDAEHEPRGDRQHVEDDHVLEHEGVEDLEREVRRHRARRTSSPRYEPRSSPARPADDDQQQRPPGAELIRSDGPKRLLRVQPVLLAVDPVVEDVDRRRTSKQKATNASELARQRRAGSKTRACEQQRREDREVLGPLPRAQRPGTRPGAGELRGLRSGKLRGGRRRSR